MTKHPQGPAPRWFALCAVALLLLVSTACGGSGGGSGMTTVVNASFVPSGTAASADHVRLRSSSVSGDTVVLEVVLGGPTTSTDLYAFPFTLVLSNPSVATYVAGSVVAGTALVPSVGQSVAVNAAMNGNRVVVGVSKTGGGLGNGTGAGETVVVRLSMRVLRAGSTTVTFGGTVTGGNPTGGPAALDSNLALVSSIQFDGVAATIVGSY